MVEVEVELPDGLLFATANEVDDTPGLDLIWVGDDGRIHAGTWSAPVELPDASPHFVNAQAELRSIITDQGLLVLFAHPTEDTEDPPNLSQIFAITESGIEPVFSHLGDVELTAQHSIIYEEDLTPLCESPSDMQSEPLGLVVVGDDPGGSGEWTVLLRIKTSVGYGCRIAAG